MLAEQTKSGREHMEKTYRPTSTAGSTAGISAKQNVLAQGGGAHTYVYEQNT